MDTKHFPLKNTAPTSWKLFLMFTRITSLTPGGGYVIVPVIGNSLVKKQWMDEAHFYDIFARAQIFPGPFALSTAILVSTELCGFWGGVAAFFGVLIPPFIVIIGVSKLLILYQDLPIVQNFLAGVGAVVPGIVAAMAYKNIKRQHWNLMYISELVILTVILILLPQYNLPILLGALVLMYSGEGICKPSK